MAEPPSERDTSDLTALPYMPRGEWGQLVAYRIARLERTVEGLEAKVDRLTFAIVTGAITLAVSVAVYALTQG